MDHDSADYTRSAWFSGGMIVIMVIVIATVSYIICTQWTISWFSRSEDINVFWENNCTSNKGQRYQSWFSEPNRLLNR
ncbi:hypothetical protein M5689_009978 [Euphorbia peplus]|nr:hypothetical protein M5689_009978 [Euphorbia peplus]